MKNEEGIYLKELNIYIIKLLNFFWLQPKLTVDLLSLCDFSDLKNNLAPFFGNFFYENFLSPYYLQENLLYVLTLLLKKEIMDLKNTSDYDSFLNKSRASCFLGELCYKNELGTYFRKIINPTIEKLEFKYWKIKLSFEIPKDDIKNNNQKEDNEDEFTDESELNLKSYEEQSIINKYFINLTQEHIIKEKDNYKGNKGKNIYEDYLNMLSKVILIDNKLFFEKFDICPELLNIYKISFSIVIDCISQLISDIKSYINSFPYTLKCVCKIISLLIEKKFPNISIREKNAFIGKYIFINIFIPLFCEPSKKLLLTKYLIFNNTEINCEVIAKIFKKLILGELFFNREKHYSPFNLFFIEKMKDVFYIYESITKVQLPEIIEKLINDKLDDNFEFNIEEINKEEIIHNKFICFQFDDIMAIVDTLDKNQDHFFKDNKNIGLRKTFEKLTGENSTEIIKMIKEDKINGLSLKSMYKRDNSNDSKDSKENMGESFNEIKHFYFYISELFINKKYQEYFKLENKATITTNLIGASEEDIIKNNIQKVKDCICIILENYQTLTERRFLEENINDTKSIFKEIQKASSLNNYFINNTIPSKWYLSSFFEYLEKLPAEYANNDYDLLFNEIEADINNFIDHLNFNFLAMFQEKLNFSKKNLDSYIYTRKKIKEAILIQKIKKIIMFEIIPITLLFDYNSNIFEIKSTHLIRPEVLQKEIRVMKEQNNTFYVIKTIESFIKAFPNLVQYQILQDENTLELIEKLNISNKMDEYIKIVDSSLEKNFQSKKLEKFARKRIYDYMMTRLYDKIYPQIEEKDDKIYQKSILLAWVEPKHFIAEDKIFDLNNIIQDFHRYIIQMEYKKSPSAKFKNLSKIFKLINDSARFYGHEIIGTDETFDILIYLLIKEQPTKLYSNCKYMQLFLLEKKGKKEDIELTQFLSLCDKIININYHDLNNITLEVFNSKCKEALNNNIL